MAKVGPKPPFVIDIPDPPTDGPLRFSSWRRLEDWARVHAEAWAKIEAAFAEVDTEEENLEILRFQGTRFTDLAKAAGQLREMSSPEPDVDQSVVKDVLDSLRDGKLLPTDTARGRWVTAMAIDTPGKALEDLKRITETARTLGLDPEALGVEPPIKFGVPDYGRRLNFQTWEGFRDWARVEEDTWGKLRPLSRMLEFGGDEILVAHHTYFSHLAGYIDTVIGAEVADQLIAVNKINSHLHGLRMGTWIPLSGRRGKQFLELADRDPQAALGMLLARPGQTVMVKDSQNRDRDIAGLIRGMIGAGQAEWEKKEAPAAAEKALEELVNEWQANFAMVDGELSESYQVSADKREQLAGLGRQIINTIRADKKQARNDLETLAKTYEEYMKLKAPATYWRSKRRIHFWAAAIAFIVFTILILVAGSFIVDNHTQIIAALPKAQDGTIGFGALVLVTIPALLFFWLLRLVSRVYVTNLHDLSDARHRETLITTFLAFVQSKEAPVSPDERLLILQALFRPPTVAPVDDAQPPSIYESLLKRVSPR